MMHSFNRREILTGLGGAFGMLALRGILGQEAARGASTLLSPSADFRKSPLAAQAPHFAPKAKSVIFLFMYGGPSHVDLFDPKPALAKWNGKPIPVFRKEDAFRSGSRNVALASPYQFSKFGQSGMEISEKYPHLAKLADDLCLIRSMRGDSNNHSPALLQMQSGSLLSGRPSFGSWAAYGLGTENENL